MKKRKRRKKGRTTIRNIYIYAIYYRPEKVIFIGMTEAENPRSAYNAHRRGERSGTWQDFSKYDGVYPDADFCLLESLSVTRPDAIKHIIAWRYYFQEAGYELVGRGSSVYDTDDFFPKTRQIYETYCKPYTEDEIFSRQVPLREDSKSKWTPGLDMTQLNVRVERTTVRRFRTFCSDHGLTQNEAMATLLVSAETSTVTQSIATIVPQKLRQQANQIQALQKQLGQRKRKDREYRQRVVYRDNEKSKMLKKAVSYIISAKGEHSPIISFQKYPSFKYSKSYFESHYPTESGAAIVTIEDVATGAGKHPPLLVMGHTEHGIPIKLRWFPRKEFAGVSIWSEQYMYKGSVWLLGYVVSARGAADIAVAVPVSAITLLDALLLEPHGVNTSMHEHNISAVCDDTPAPGTAVQDKPSLADQIAHAETRVGHKPKST